MNNNTQPVITVTSVDKSFRLPHEKNNSLKDIIVNPLRKRAYENQHALRNVNLEIKEGEFFGIVGRNGSGKSTLLKLIAGIYSPTSGRVQVRGKLTPFIELGVGFSPDLSGRENVFLNGALLGFSRSEMNDIYDEIVEFAELEGFMDQKLKNYSSGMQVRLAFSIAIQADSDILLLDEVLAVGDYNFQQKCFEYFHDLKRDKKTVILVSHDASVLQMFCTRSVLIDSGKVVREGNITDVLKEYAKQNLTKQAEQQSKTKDRSREIEKGNGAVELEKVVITQGSNKKSPLEPNTPTRVNIRVKLKRDVEDPVFGFVVQSANDNSPIIATNTLDLNIKTGKHKKGETVSATFEFDNILADGKYYISGAVASSDRSILYARFLNAAQFTTAGRVVTAQGRVYNKVSFEIEK